VRRRRSLARQILRGLAFAALGAIALLLLALATFPFDRLGSAVAAQIQRETRIAASFDTVDAHLTLRGPVLAATGVTLAWPTGEVLRLDSLDVRVARPSAWLRGVPTAHVATRTKFGSFSGVVSRDRVAGRLTGLDPARLPQAWFGEGGSLVAGPVDADVDLEHVAAQWTGRVLLDGESGSLALPGSPVAIPYERLRADARLDPIGTLQIVSLELEGPLVSAHARGEVGAGYAGPATGPIAIEAEVGRLDPALVPIVEQYGVTLDADGAGRLTISGTPDRIDIR
jgi:type II secretion system protein N